MGQEIRGALVVTALVAAMLVAVAASAGAQESGQSAADCGAKVYRIVFWPEGHPAVVGFGSEYAVPHVEIYKGKGKKYPPEGLFGFAEPGTAQITGPECEAAEVVDAPKEPKKVKKLTDAAVLTCKTKKSPILGTNTGVPEGGAAFTLTLGSRRVAVVTVAPLGAQITNQVFYNSKLCKKSDVPS